MCGRSSVKSVDVTLYINQAGAAWLAGPINKSAAAASDRNSPDPRDLS
jgi:hypothetical protein